MNLEFTVESAFNEVGTLSTVETTELTAVESDLLLAIFDAEETGDLFKVVTV